MSASAAIHLIASAQRSSSPLKARRVRIARIRKPWSTCERTAMSVALKASPLKRVFSCPRTAGRLSRPCTRSLRTCSAPMKRACRKPHGTGSGLRKVAPSSSKLIRTRSNRSAAFDAEFTGTGGERPGLGKTPEDLRCPGRHESPTCRPTAASTARREIWSYRLDRQPPGCQAREACWCCWRPALLG